MDLIIEIVAWAAAGIMLGAYALLSRGRLSGQGSPFQSLNIVGSLLVGANSFVHEAWPSVSVNAVWLIIGVVSLAANRRDRDAPTGDRSDGRADHTDRGATACGRSTGSERDLSYGTPSHVTRRAT